MLRNRALQVDVVKKNVKDAKPERDALDFETKLALVSRAVEKSIVKIGAAVCVYVILDTARKVVIEATKPV